jgi:hypothetical protein
MHGFSGAGIPSRRAILLVRSSGLRVPARAAPLLFPTMQIGSDAIEACKGMANASTTACESHQAAICDAGVSRC